MDTITHGIVGALLGKAFFAEDPSPLAPGWTQTPRTAGRVAIISATLGAIFPDIDVFAGPLAHNSMAFLTWHRGITHSLVMLPLWSLALAAITYWLARSISWPAPAFTTLIAVYALGIGSHIFLDLITSYGTMIWSPLDYVRPAWDWVFIIDLTVTSLALMPQLAAWAFRRPKQAFRRAIPLWAICSGAAFSLVPLLAKLRVPFSAGAAVGAAAVFAIFFILPLRHGTGTRVGRAKWCRIGLGLLACYLGFAGALHHSALEQVTQFAEAGRIPYTNIAALPLPPTLERWAGLIATPEGVYRLQFSEFSGDPVAIRFFDNSAPNRYIDAARGLRGVQTFLWFARFPRFQYFEMNGQPVVRITDLRFYGDRLRSRDDLQGDVTGLATYQVVFKPDRQIVSEGLLRLP